MSRRLTSKAAPSPDQWLQLAVRALARSDRTTAQIERLLFENGLELIGFEIEPRTLERYRERFPQDNAATDLSCWHVFEQDNPATFGAMYQFWAQPRATS